MDSHLKQNKTNQPTEVKKLLKPVSFHAVIDQECMLNQLPFNWAKFANRT